MASSEYDTTRRATWDNVNCSLLFTAVTLCGWVVIMTLAGGEGNYNANDTLQGARVAGQTVWQPRDRTGSAPDDVDTTIRGEKSDRSKVMHVEHAGSRIVTKAADWSHRRSPSM